MDYLSWNNYLAKHFFRHEFAGRRVFLFVTEELITVIGQQYDVGFDDYISAVLAGPPWVKRSGLCHIAYDTFIGWRDRDLEYPPYIGYLCLFVIAAGHEGDFSPISYYPRLRELILEPPNTGQYPYFNKMLELWDDLEEWSIEDQSGERGIFRTYIQGRKIHIGLPLSQTFMTQQELSKLPEIFAASGFDPTDTPSDLELLFTTLTHGREYFRRSTIKLLDPTQQLDNALRATLAETLRSELSDWDGSIVPSENGVSTSSKYISLAICCDRFDPVSKKAEFELRCRAADGIPDNGLSLCEDTKSPPIFFCEPAAFPWSSPLVDASGVKINARSIDWLTGAKFINQTASETCRLIGRKVHLLAQGELQGLPGFIGINRLSRNQSVYLLTHDSATLQIKNWGVENCDGFEDVGIRTGLPDGWTMFKVDSVLSDQGIADVFPSLALPITARLLLQGGVRATRGNHFFTFSPPLIHLEGLGGAAEILFDGSLLTMVSGDGSYQIPSSKCSEGHHNVEVRFADNLLKARFSLVETFPWRVSKPGQSFDLFGALIKPEDDNIPGIAGALSQAEELPVFSFNTLLEVAEYDRVIFIGCEPGQIIDWPRENLPDLWSPIWAIPMRRKGFAVFCGESIAGAEPVTSAFAKSKASRRWKEILWYQRYRIAPPLHPALQTLWNTYKNVARSL